MVCVMNLDAVELKGEDKYTSFFFRLREKKTSALQHVQPHDTETALRPNRKRLHNPESLRCCVHAACSSSHAHIQRVMCHALRIITCSCWQHRRYLTGQIHWLCQRCIVSIYLLYLYTFRYIKMNWFVHIFRVIIVLFWENAIYTYCHSKLARRSPN